MQNLNLSRLQAKPECDNRGKQYTNAKRKVHCVLGRLQNLQLSNKIKKRVLTHRHQFLFLLSCFPFFACSWVIYYDVAAYASNAMHRAAASNETVCLFYSVFSIDKSAGDSPTHVIENNRALRLWKMIASDKKQTKSTFFVIDLFIALGLHK